MSDSAGTFSFRWGISWLDEAQRGGVFTPGFIMRNYAKAGVKPAEMMCINHISAYHYDSPNGQASPSLSTIAEQMGYADERSVSRLVKAVENKGLLIVVERPGKTNIYDAAPLAQKCLELELGEGAVEQLAEQTNIPTKTPPTNLSGVPDLSDEDIEDTCIIAKSNDVPDGKPDDFKAIQTLIIDFFFEGNWANANWAGGLANMLLGRSDKPQFAPYNLSPPVTATELELFCIDYAKLNIDWVTDPKKLNQRIYKWRKSAINRLDFSKQPEPEPITTPIVMPQPLYNADGTSYQG